MKKGTLFLLVSVITLPVCSMEEEQEKQNITSHIITHILYAQDIQGTLMNKQKNLLAIKGQDGLYTALDLKNQEKPIVENAYDITLCPLGNTIAVISDKHFNYFRLYDMKKGTSKIILVEPYPSCPIEITKMQYSPDGKHLAVWYTETNYNFFQIYMITTEEIKPYFANSKSDVKNGVSFSPDGTKISIPFDNRESTCIIYSLLDEKEKQLHHFTHVNKLQFITGGSGIAITYTDKKKYRFEMYTFDTNRLKNILPRLFENIGKCHVSPDGTTFALKAICYSYEDCICSFYHLGKGKLKCLLEEKNVGDIKFSKDSSTISMQLNDSYNISPFWLVYKFQKETKKLKELHDDQNIQQIKLNHNGNILFIQYKGYLRTFQVYKLESDHYNTKWQKRLNQIKTFKYNDYKKILTTHYRKTNILELHDIQKNDTLLDRIMNVAKHYISPYGHIFVARKNDVLMLLPNKNNKEISDDKTNRIKFLREKITELIPDKKAYLNLQSGKKTKITLLKSFCML